MESISQTTAPSAPVSSVTPTASVPDSASQFATSSPSNFQAPAPAQAAPQAPATYQQQAAPQVSAQEVTDMRNAFQALTASLNSPQVSQAQVPYSAYQTPTPQASIPAPLASQPQLQVSQAQPTYAPQASTPTYSAQEAAYLSQLQAEQAAPAVDSYLSQISDQSLEVLEHFGAEAPALLNQYACAVEDALIEQVGRNNSMNTMLDAASEERAAMNVMLTDPDVLADYVNGFFGENGPYPTETAEETAAREQYEARAQFEAEIEAQEQRGVPQSFERPQMDIPTPGRQESGGGQGWNEFGSMMDNNPENAWKYLSNASPEFFQQKMLVQDY